MMIKSTDLITRAIMILYNDGRSINKLQNSAVSLILKISKNPKYTYVESLFWNTL